MLIRSHAARVCLYATAEKINFHSRAALMRTASLLILVCFLLSACAAPTALRSSSVDDAMPSLAQPQSGDELVGIAISGGGSRAATFASYVLEELARIDVGRDAPASMLERVQYISS